MRKFSRLTVFLFSGWLQVCVLGSAAQAEVPEEIRREAQTLIALEKKYFEDRLNARWEALYETQHPEFRKKVSLEEYRFFDGNVMASYRDAVGSHISGVLIPPLSYIKENPDKKDALGFPVLRKYKWFVNPFITVQAYTQGKLSISRDGKHAISRITLTGRERLNPALIRKLYEFDFKRDHIDFWEKVDGRWVIPVLTVPASISGARVMYYVPNNNDAWGEMDFYDIEPTVVPVEGK